ncbi:MAG: hypothetical protein SchgKO_02750 [Schleiferiaceae bacterium]
MVLDRLNIQLDSFGQIRWAAWLIFALNFALRLPSLFTGDITLDETISVFHAQQDWADIYTFSTQEPNPPLYYLLLALWIRIFGIEEWGVRLLSVLLISLAGLYLFKSLKENGKVKMALWASLLFLFNGRFIWYQNEVRTYALIAFFAAFSTYYLLKLLKNSDASKRTWWILGVAYGLMMLSHYMAFWIPVIHLLFVAVYYSKFSLKHFVGAGILGALLFSPFVIFAIRNMPEAGKFWLQPPTVKTLWFTTLRLIDGHSTLVFIKCLLITSAFFLPTSSKAEKKFNGLLLASFVLILLGTFFIAQKTPVFLTKYLLSTSYLPLLLTAWAFVKWTELYSWAFVGAGVFVLMYGVGTSFYPYKTENYQKMIPALEVSPEKPYYISPFYYWKPVIYYYNRDEFKKYSTAFEYLEGQGFKPTWNLTDILKDKSQPEVRLIFRGDPKQHPVIQEARDYWSEYDEYRCGMDLFILTFSNL